tara:strand:+ start:1197 stop:1580 length:384 start_codon:yes stop_codon:yes gene_type:complete
MDRVIKTILGVTVILALVMIAMSAAAQGPTIKRLGTYRGDNFAGFAEFRVQDIEYGDMGQIRLTGAEPYDMLMNVTFITSVYRYEDAKKTDYSTLIFTDYMKEPLLIRQPYKDVCSSIEKAMEKLSK